MVKNEHSTTLFLHQRPLFTTLDIYYKLGNAIMAFTTLTTMFFTAPLVHLLVSGLGMWRPFSRRGTKRSHHYVGGWSLLVLIRGEEILSRNTTIIHNTHPCMAMVVRCGYPHFDNKKTCCANFPFDWLQCQYEGNC